MRETTISLPELALLAGTRGALGFGLGLLLADRFAADQRRGIGWALFLVGAVSTLPLALDIFGRSSEPPSDSAEAWSRLAHAQNA